jgi:hypothetical protein
VPYLVFSVNERTWQRVYANMVLRTKTGLRGRKKHRKKLHSEELHNLYFSQNIFRKFNTRIDGEYGMKVREWNFI